MLLNKNPRKKNTICEVVQQTNYLLGEKSNWGIGSSNIYFFHPVWNQQNKKIKMVQIAHPMCFVVTSNPWLLLKQRCLAEKPKTQTLHWSNGAWGIGEVMVRMGRAHLICKVCWTHAMALLFFVYIICSFLEDLWSMAASCCIYIYKYASN